MMSCATCYLWMVVACSDLLLGLRAQPKNASVRIYFGNGCFWARQHMFVLDFEQKILGRKNDNVSAIAGYAGSKATGPRGSACYHNPQNFSDYGSLGHAEAVEVDIPLNFLDRAFALYFGSFIEFDKDKWVRPDIYDQGAEYRSLVGVPGGMSNAQVLAALRRANVNNMTLQTGYGSDPDTFSTNNVFVMDSLQFHFIQAELCLQFHDDQVVKYPESYHRLLQDSQKTGRLASTTCPPNFVCNSTSRSSLKDATILI